MQVFQEPGGKTAKKQAFAKWDQPRNPSSDPACRSRPPHQKTMALQDRYINPLTDFGFKKLFGTEYNKDLLMDFLNELLPAQHKIQELNYARSEFLGAGSDNRNAIFDLYCTSQKGDKFIVEVQKAKQNWFKDRSVYYSSFPIQEQAKKGDWNFRLDAVYTIGVLDFVFDDHKKDEKLLHYIQLKDQDCQVFYDKLSYIYLELPKFTKNEAELKSHFDKWLFVLKHLSNLQNRPAALQEKVFQKLFATAEIAQFSPKEREAYEESLKAYRDMKNVVDTAKEEGLKEGRKEGLKEGIQEGKRETIIQVAMESIRAGLPTDTISKITGLSEAEIEELRKKQE